MGDIQTDLYDRLSVLRTQALDVLEQAARSGFGRDRALSEVIERVQSAANQLGEAESMLRPAPPLRAAAAKTRPISTTRKPRLSQDAAVVLALGGTAVPFAASIEDEAERWVRVLRMHGQVGEAMQALGVAEGPLQTPAAPKAVRLMTQRPPGEDVIEMVAERSMSFVRERGGECVTTVDVLFAILETYGSAFDRALYARGTTRSELLDRLADEARVR